jgi:hypothetical protein
MRTLIFTGIFLLSMAGTLLFAQVDSVAILDTAKDYNYYGSTGVELLNAPPKRIPRYDSSIVQEKFLSHQDLQEYFDDSSFDYGRNTPEQTSLWEMFKNWFWGMIEQLLGTKLVGKISDVLKYILIALAIAVVNIILFRSNLRGLFGGKQSKASIGFTILDENIHTLNFPEQITAAEERADYRHAVRLHYLWLLKRLSDDMIIQLKINKTNRDYRNEISSPELRNSFSRASRIFEHVWYGNVPINGDSYEYAKQLFTTILSPAVHV